MLTELIIIAIQRRLVEIYSTEQMFEKTVEKQQDLSVLEKTLNLKNQS